MDIRKVKILYTGDTSKNGLMTVIENDTQNIFEVFYTSPFGAGKHGGFISLPIPGQLCLVCSIGGSDSSWYYMSSIYGKDKIDYIDMGEDTPYYAPEEEAFGDFDKTIPKRSKTYDSSGFPNTYTWSSPAGNMFEIIDGDNPSIKMLSQKGKFILLGDGYNGDAIVIQNEHGDRISIASRNNNEAGLRGISAICKGNVFLESKEGSVNIRVVDGEEINIINKSHDASAAANINITTYEGDINLASYGEDGSINLTTKYLTSPINIKSGGDINLDAKGKINLKAALGINIVTLGSLDFEGVLPSFNSISIQAIYAAILAASQSIPTPLIDLLSTQIFNSLEFSLNDYND